MAKKAKEVGIAIRYQVHHQKKRKTKRTFLVRDFGDTFSRGYICFFSEAYLESPLKGESMGSQNLNKSIDASFSIIAHRQFCGLI